MSSIGEVVFNDHGEDITVERALDGFLTCQITFVNNHPTVSIGLGRPRGLYAGSGKAQYAIDSIEVELLALSQTRQLLIDRLWMGQEPTQTIPKNLYRRDLQGWNSQHPFLSETIELLRPSLIVEIGVWKGGSVVFMANELKKKSLAAQVVAVDTWLGSSEHWTGPEREELNLLNGHPMLYYTFLSNLLGEEVSNYVVPVPVDSLNAAQILRSLSLRPSMVHLDGGHDYGSVMADLGAWWPLLEPGGAFIGDDYFAAELWPEVKLAFDNFFSDLQLTPIENVDGKCRIWKPR